MRERFPEVAPVYEGTAKHVFSHRIHLLSVCSARVKETFCPEGYEWWSSQRIRAFGTTTWLLLVGVEERDHGQMLKTAKRSVASLKRLK